MADSTDTTAADQPRDYTAAAPGHGLRQPKARSGDEGDDWQPPAAPEGPLDSARNPDYVDHAFKVKAA